MRSDWLAATVLALLSPALSAVALASNAVTANSFTVERPTLLSLGFEWRIGGDDNRNATVTVSYRKKGEEPWRAALPLLRLGGERVTGYPAGPSRYGVRATSIYDYTAPAMFAGSILNLQPDTEYECRFQLSDPDGVSGTAQQTVTVRTRKAPAPVVGGQVYHVYPSGFKGPVQEPAFYSLMGAYYRGADESDHSLAYPPRVQPGDTILVHAGIYQDARRDYSGFDPKAAAYGTPFDGTYFLTASGTADRPIVIKAAGDGEVIFDGDGNFNLFNLLAANYNYFEGITVRNTEVAFLLGWKNIAGASGFTLVHSRIYDVGRVVQDEWSGSKDFYIADNVFIGRHDPEKLQSWYYRPEVWSKFPGYPAPITSEYAIKVYGQGHVVAFNYVANWHDGIDVSTYGTPDQDPERNPSAIDFYNNDLYNMADNCIEADGGAQNIRVFNNRCINSAAGAFSAQPIFGGPVYFYRNLSFGGTSGGPLKLIDTPSGILIYQNTFIGEGRLTGPASNVHFRNNLFVGDNWAEPLFNFSTFTNYSSSDYNGFRPNPGTPGNFGWNSPDFAVAADFATPLIKRAFASLPDYRKASGQDRHSVLVDYGVFRKVSPPDPADPQHLDKPEDYDFSLARGSVAIDKGVVLPGITDGFTGRAPDLGAFEYGQPLPHYGPHAWPIGSVPADAPRSIAGPPRDAGVVGRAMILPLSAAEVAGAPDLILAHGTVITVDPRDSVGQAIAIRDGKVVRVGTDAAILALAAPRTRIIDLHGRTATPGLIDTHAHVAEGGLAEVTGISLGDAVSVADIVKRVRERVSTLKPGEWVQGTGWDEGKLGEHRYVLAGDLDAVAPNNPVWLEQTSGHYGVANGYALKLAKITAATQDPPAGTIDRDAAGAPTGVLKEDAANLVTELIPPASPEQRRQGLLAMMDRLHQEGMTAYKDPDDTQADWDTYRSLLDAGQLTAHVCVLWHAGTTVDSARAVIKTIQALPRPPNSLGNGALMSCGAKIFMDGSGAGRTAWTYQEWNKNQTEVDHGNFGYPSVDPAVYRQMVRLLHQAHISVGTHAIGDRAIDWVVDTYADVLKEQPTTGLRHSIIHANFPTDHAIEVMAGLQKNFDAAYPEVQPTFIWWIGDNYAGNLGAARAMRLEPLKTLLARGVSWSGGSDFDVTPIPARYGLWAAIERQTLKGTFGAHPFGTAESVDVHAALRSYTALSARQLFLEDKIGSLEPGKEADLAVWDRNLYSMPSSGIKDLKCEMTLFHGRVVYEAK